MITPMTSCHRKKKRRRKDRNTRLQQLYRKGSKRVSVTGIQRDNGFVALDTEDICCALSDHWVPVFTNAPS